MIALAVIAAAIALGSTQSPGWPSAGVALGVIAILLAAGGCTLACSIVLPPAKGAARFIHIGPAFLIYGAVTFGLTSLDWLHSQPAGEPRVARTSVVVALVLVVVAFASWTTGYLIPPFRLLARNLGTLAAWSTNRPALRLRFSSLPILLYAIATVSRFLQLRAQRFGYLQNVSLALSSPSGYYQFLEVLDALALLAILLAALDVLCLSRSTRSKVTLILLLVTETCVGAFAASKETVLVALLAPALLYVVVRGRVSRGGVLVFGLTAMVLFSFNLTYRNSIRTQSNVGEAISPSAAATALPKELVATVAQNPLALFSDSYDEASTRLRAIDSLALVVDKTPSAIAYRPWSELASGPATGLVPRVFWPGKPVLSTGEEASRLYYEIPRQVVTASALTIPGDLYRHGGILPLICGMIVLGAIARLLDGAFDPTSSARRAIALIPLLILLVRAETDFTSLLVSIAQTLIVVVVVVRLSFRPMASRRSTA